MFAKRDNHTLYCFINSYFLSHFLLPTFFNHVKKATKTSELRKWIDAYESIYSKTCVKLSLSKRQKIDFHDQLSLNTGEKYCRMLHSSLRSLFCLFFKDHFTQVLKLYVISFK